MPAMSTPQQHLQAPPDPIVPFRHWWGLLGCAALMGVIFLMAPYSADIEFAPDKGDWWYYWQLPDATVWTRLSAWIPYSLHQIAIWYLQGGNDRPVVDHLQHNAIGVGTCEKHDSIPARCFSKFGFFNAQLRFALFRLAS